MRPMTSLLAGCLIASAVLAANEVLSMQLADAFEKKIVAVQKNAEVTATAARTTSFTEAETNSYLKFKSGSLLPTGLTDPMLTIAGQGLGRVSGKAVVDLDVVRRTQSSGGWLDPTSYLTGKLPVAAVGRVITGDGKGRFELESAELSGIPMPRTLVAQLVNFFTRTADNPKGSSIDDVFDLPAHIQRIDIETGRFTIIQ